MLGTTLITTIYNEQKISPAFAPFLSGTGPNDIRDAIVIYRSPESNEPPARGRMRALRAKVKEADSHAKAQLAIQRDVQSSYQKAGSKGFPSRKAPKVAPIGSNTLPVLSVEVTPRTLSVLADNPHVVAILPNQKISLIQPKTVDYKALLRQEEKDGITWGLKQLEIPELWKRTRGKGVNIAVLDTGVYAAHPALAGRVADFILIDSLGRRIKTDHPFDAGSHGTHVSGVIAGGKTERGVSIGVAPEASLLVGAVLVGDSTLRSLMEGISWAVENDADIINMSLGFSYFEPLFDEVFKILLDQFGILPVVAVGNENHGNSSSPGNAFHSFSVGAVEKVKGGKTEIAFFSSGASLVFPGHEFSPLVTKPDVVAPGVQVYSCIPGDKRPDGVFEYNYMNGTSMATPHVTGVAALLMAANPNVPTERIIRVLKETARHPSGEGLRPDNRWGYGIIRPVEALQALER
jgi:serine protease AprX